MKSPVRMTLRQNDVNGDGEFFGIMVADPVPEGLRADVEGAVEFALSHYPAPGSGAANRMMFMEAPGWWFGELAEEVIGNPGRYCVTMSHIKSRSEEEIMNATVTIRMEDYEKETLTEFASFMGMTFSEWARQTLCEAYEDYMDYQIAVEAKREFDKNPVTYTAEEVERMFGVDDVDA